MFNKKSVAKALKRTLALVLATATVATGSLSGEALLNQTEEYAASSSNVLSNADRGVLYANSRTDFRDETIYFLITTRFYDGDSSNNTRTSEDKKAQNPENDPSWRGDFAGLIEKLDYIKALGFTAIWITPVVENDSGYDYHGYHAYNFDAVDTRYESNGVTYQTLIDAVHEKGMKLIQDVVLNHTCNWGEVNLLQITSDNYPTRNQVVMNGNGDPDNLYHHNGFCGGGDWDNFEAQRKTIADDCFDLNTENPEVYNYLVDCYTKYIKMGVDGFRIDTVKHISRLTFNSVFLPAFKEAGGEDFYMFGEVCTKGHDVWYRSAPPISTCFYTWADDASWLGKWTTNEATNNTLVEEHYYAHMDTSSQPTSNNAFLNGNEYHTPDYSKKSGMDVIDFQMHWSFNDANSAFSTALGEDKYFNDSTWNVVYVDSHDYAPDQCQTQRYTGGTNKWAENLSLMFTFRGIPCIYYGSEIEFQKGKPIDVGPNAPLSETGRAYFGDHIEGNVDTSDFTVFGNLSGEVKNTLNSTLSQHIMRLNRLRQAIPALRKGQYSTEGCDGNIAFKRRYTDSTTDSFALVAISGGATFSGIPNGKYVDAVTGDVKNVTNGTLIASVSGQGNMKIYVLDTAKTPAPGRVIPNGDYLTDGGSAQLIGEETIVTVPVTGITLNKSSVSVLEEESVTVTATIAPSNATSKNVTWSSSNTAVATVNGGVITGVAPGTATITAKTTNGLTATVKVTVSTNPNIVRPTGVTLSPTTLTITEGETGTLTATVAPSNATNKNVTWTTSNASVATVDASGIVTAVSEGTATITATTSNGYKATATVTVAAKQFPTIENGVYFEKPSGWGSTIYAYMWNSSTQEKYLGDWPGTKIDNLQDNIYGFSYSAGDSNTMIIFNDNSNQTADLNFKSNGYYNSTGLVKIIDNNVVTGEGKVYVKYVDEDGNVLSSKTLSGTVGASYSTSAMTISGYTLKTTPSNASGTYTSSAITVTYVYTKDASEDDDVSLTPYTNGVFFENNQGWSTVNIYYWSDSNKGMISWPGTAMTKVGTAENGNAIYGYDFGSDSSIQYVIFNNGSSAAQTEDLNYTNNGYYTFSGCQSTVQATGKVVVKYVDESGNEIATAVTKKGTVGNSYTTSAATVDGYTLKTTPSNANGKYTTADITVTYVYSKDEVVVTPLSGSLTVNGSTAALTKTVGDSITLNASATGGSGSYTYKFAVLNVETNVWTVLQNYKSNSSYTFALNYGGVKQFAVTVKDSDGTTVSTNRINVTVEEDKLPLSGSLKVNGSTADLTKAVGSSITLNASATGGSGSYTYKFAVLNENTGVWTVLKNFSNSASYTTELKYAGVKQFAVTVKDSTGATVATNRLRVVAVNPTAELSGTLQVNGSTEALTKTVGSTITLNAVAAGGSGSYTYKFAVLNEDTGVWTVLRDFSSSTSYTTALKYAGAKQFAVTVKDSTGKTVATNRISVKAVEESVELKGTLKGNGSTAAITTSVQNNVVLEASATGGSGNYSYKFAVLDVETGKWTVLQYMSSESTYIYAVNSTGTLQFAVTVQDSDGTTVATNRLTVTVK